MITRVATERTRRAAPAERRAPLPPVAGDLAWAARLSWLVAALLTVSSVGGLAWGTRGLYQPDSLLLPQFLGQDAVSLALAVPLLLGSMRAARRGSARGLLLWSGTLAYAAYWYYFYVAGVRFGPLFPVHLALVSASGYGLVALLARVDAAAVRARFAPGFRARLVGGFLAGSGVLFAALWTADLVRRLRAGEPLDNVSRHVYIADLVVMLPALVAGGVALWRRRPWGYALGGLLLLKVDATMLLLLVNAALVRAWGEPVDAGQTAAYAATLVAAGACSALYFRAVHDGPAAGPSTCSTCE